MSWFKKEHQKVITPQAFANILLRLTVDNVKDARQTFQKHLNSNERRSSKLIKVNEELAFFFVFALDYWWTMDSRRSREERDIVRQIFVTNMAEFVSLEMLQERLIAYAQIINEVKGDNAKFTGFGMKLSEFCGMPHAFFLVLAPALFTKAGESLESLKSVRLKLR